MGLSITIIDLTISGVFWYFVVTFQSFGGFRMTYFQQQRRRKYIQAYLNGFITFRELKHFLSL